MKLTSQLKQSSREAGFASLIIAAILVVVLGLLTVGFAELMRHSQTQELNRQLSDQAYYAAESGVNDAVRALSNNFSGQKQKCGKVDSSSPLYGKTGSKYLSDNHVTTAANGATEWTCLLINPTPGSLKFDSVGTTTPRTFIAEPVNSSGGAVPISSLDIYWEGADKSNTHFLSSSASSCGNSCFPKATSWTAPGMLRLSITPFDPNNISRSDLIKDTYTAFLYPTTAGPSAGTYQVGNTTGFGTNAGPIMDGGCQDPPLPTGKPLYCGVTIGGFSSYPAGTEYLISLRSIYSPTDVEIDGPSNVEFTGAQTLVDSTGRSQNVLKRIQVRVPDKNVYPFPGFDAEATGSICKKLTAGPAPVGVNLSC